MHNCIVLIIAIIVIGLWLLAISHEAKKTDERPAFLMLGYFAAMFCTTAVLIACVFV